MTLGAALSESLLPSTSRHVYLFVCCVCECVCLFVWLVVPLVLFSQCVREYEEKKREKEKET